METLQRTANRGSVSTGYDVGNSLKVESDNDEYLERPTGSPDGNSTQHTISVWVKRTELGVDSEPVSAGGIGRFRFESDDTFSYQFRSGKEIRTNRVFRDTAAWYHIVAAADSSQSTASNRMKLYVNGVEETSFSAATYQDQDQASPGWGKYTIYNLRVGAAASNTRNFNGYIAEMYYIDGQTLDPTSFGEFDSDSGIWIPKAFSGTHGTLDTYLNFSDSSNLGKNSGGTTDLGANNITAADQSTDTCTNNFAIINTLFKYPSSQVINEGATKVDRTSGSGINKTFYSTFAMTAGKFYFEAQPTEGSGTMIGVESITTASNTDADSVFVGQQSTGVGYYASNGQKFTSGSGSSYGDTYGNSDIIGVALDMDNRKVYFAKNNTYQNSGDPTSGSTGTGAIDLPDTSDGYVFAVSYDSGGQWVVNFGGFTTMSISSSASDGNSIGAFEFAPPSGYLALCTKNLGSDGG